MKKISLLFLTLIVGVVFFTSITVAAPIVFLEPGDDPPTPGEFSLNVLPGSSFSLDVYVQLLEAEYPLSKGLYGAGVRTEYSEAGNVVTRTGATINSASFDPAWSQVDTSSADEVGFLVVDYYPGTGEYGNILIGTISFSAGNAGTSVFTTKDWGVGSDFMTWEEDVFDDVVEFRGGTVNVVPIPSAVLLLGTGLVGLVAMRRRHR